MSTTVDNRVVEMQFDNSNFEKNVSTTMSTLAKLKQSLNLTGATKGLEDVDEATKRVNMAGLGTAVETVQAKFSALQVMGVTALANITNSAVNAGKKIVSALTIDPIKTGLSEYETQINAVQTILANTESKGSTLTDVNRALDELNKYADMTIYNFTEMTRNIGTFTAAGVDLDTSVSSIQGIANLAAISGSNSQQASTAMYQLSQALSAGSLKLQDWNSVVNAGMGGQVFQDALKRTATIMGTNVDAMIEKAGSFRESLSEGWITADVLTETLNQFTMAAEEGTEEWDVFMETLKDKGYTEEQAKSILNMANTATNAATKVKTFSQLWDTLQETAQSGWTSTWEIIFGDFEEAKELFSEMFETLAPLLESMNAARNNLLEGGLSSGWKQLLNQGIANEEDYIDVVKDVAKEHGISVDEMIEKEGSFTKTLKDKWLTSDMLTESIHKYGDKLRAMSADELKAAGYTKEHIFEIEKLEKAIDSGTVSAEEFANLMGRPSGRENLVQSLRNAFQALMSVFMPIKEAFREIFPPASAESLYNLTVAIKDFTEKLKLSEENAEKLKQTFKGVFAIVDIVVDFVKAIAVGAVNIIKSVTGIKIGFLDATASIGDWLVSLRDSVKEGNIFGRAIGKISGFISNAIDKIKEFGNSIVEKFGGATKEGNGLVNFFKSLWGIVKTLSTGVINAVTSIGQGVADALGKESFSDVLSGGLFAGAMAALIKFVSGLKNPFDSISDLVEGLTGEGGLLENVTGVLDDVRGCFQAYQDQLKAETLKKIAIAIGILAAAIWVISSIDSEAMGRSLGAITVLFTELMASLGVFTKLAGNLKGVAKASALMISLSASLLILSFALKILGSMSLEQMGVALLGLTASIGSLVGAIRLLPEKDVILAAKAIKTLSSALVVLAIALKIMGSMSWSELAVGLTAVVVGLGAMVGAINLFPKDMGAKASSLIAVSVSLVILSAALKIMASMTWEEIGKGLTTMAVGLGLMVAALRLFPKDMAVKASMLIAVATAMVILGAALKIMGSMSWDEVGRGLVVLAGSLYALGIALNVMNDTLAGSAALMVAAIAIGLLTPAIKSLGEMSWGSIIKSLVTLVGVLAVLGVASLILGPIIPLLLGVSAAMLLFGTGMLALGAGMTLLGVGIGAVASALSIGAATIVAGLSVIITGLLGLIPDIVLALGEIILAVCKVVGECAPQIADTVLKLLSEVLVSLATYIPQIANSLFELLIGLLDVLVQRLPELIAKTVEVIGAFFRGVVDALGNVDTKTMFEGILIVGLLSGLMYALSLVAAVIPAAMVGVLGIGAVVAELGLVLAAIGALGQIPGLAWLVEEGGNFLEKIGTAIGQFIGGIAGGVAQGFTSSLPQIGIDLSSFMTNLQPFIEGAKGIDASMMDGVNALVGAILALTGANLLEGLTSWLTGGSSLSDFGAEIAEFAPHLKAYSDAVAGIDGAAITASSKAAKALVEMASNLPKDGGLAGFFAGDSDISDFGNKLIPFGEGLKGYADAVAGIDGAAITTSATGAKKLAEIASNIPTDPSVLASFGGVLVSFGDNLSSFFTSTSGITESVVSTTNTAIESVKKATTLNSDNLASTASAIGKLTKSLREMTGINESSVAGFVNAIDALANTNVSGLVSAFDNAGPKLSNAGSKLITSLTDGAKAKQSLLISNCRSMVDAMSNAVISRQGAFTKAGSQLMTSFVKSISTSGSRMSSAVTSSVSKATVSIRGYYTAFSNAGKYLVQGFCDGINANTWRAEAKAKAMARAAELAAKKELDINSPSKVFMEIGGWVPKGFAKGIEMFKGLVTGSSSSMANSAVKSARSAMGQITDAFNADINAQPTIRPVMDLSNVTSGAKAISSLFEDSPLYGSIGNVTAIGRIMNQRNQNGRNDDVVSAINSLRGDIGNLENTTYSINGITYSGESDVADAFRTIARAVLMERRM